MAISIQSKKLTGVRGNPSLDNIVVTVYLDGIELNLDELNDSLEHTTYNPEKYPAIIYKISNELDINSSTTANIFSSGKAVIVGGKTNEDINATVDELVGILEDKLETNINHTEAVNNMIVMSTYKTEFNLTSLTIHLGLEDTEYEPEQFPAIVKRLSVNNSSGVALIFTSGKVAYVGANSVNEVLELKNHLEKELDDFMQFTESA